MSVHASSTPFHELPIAVEQVTPPAQTAILLDQVKAHSRIDFDEEDGLLGAYIAAAIDYAERVTGRSFINRTLRQVIDRFPTGRMPIELERPPLVSVSDITYIDAAGDEQVMDPTDYDVDTSTIMGTVSPAYGRSWPLVRRGRRAVQITFTAGYGESTADLPATITQALIMLVGHWYEHREPIVVGTIVAHVPHSVESLLSLNRVVRAA